jgi:hypothetical protein
MKVTPKMVSGLVVKTSIDLTPNPSPKERGALVSIDDLFCNSDLILDKTVLKSFSTS